jgi:hypothetical protein
VERGRGVNSMVAVLLIAGIGLLLAGLLAVGFGIPVKEFSFGNTLIITGAIVACTGAMMLGFWMVVRELKNIAQRLGPGISLGSEALGARLGNQAPEDIAFPFSRDQSGPEHPGDAESPPPWHEEAASRGRSEVAAPEPVEPSVKPRRNLLFSTTSRKERERAQARTAEPSAADIRPASAPSPTPPQAAEPVEASPVTFDDAWPKPERARPAEVAPARRGGRAPSIFADQGAGAPAEDRVPLSARIEEPPPVTVLKSGVVDGMAYSLYSDGSIEAQMPEGMMRFASIDELRAHLDQRP